MNKKNVLIVSRSFYPTISPRSFRASELAKELSRQGHHVTILTHKKRNFNYTKYEHRYGLQIKDFVFDKWKEVKRDGFLKKALRILLNQLFHYPDIQYTFLLKKQLKNEFNYDLLISLAIPYPVHWGVALAKKGNSNLTKIWVADCGDPFMGDKERRFKPAFYFHCIEKWFCNKPDHITVPVKEAIDAYPLACRKKIKVIPQGFNFEEIETDQPDNNSEQMTFGYAGSFNKGSRDPQLLLDYLSQLKDLDFKFVIYTKSTSIVKPYKKILGEKLVIKEYIPRLQLLKELSRMNFLVNVENKYDVQSPSKIIDYALTGRPILSVNPTDVNENVVNEFLNGNFKNQMKIREIDKYNIKNVAQQFLDLLKQ